jgi:asparagine synthase (glutamine-hydrolysing)
MCGIAGIIETNRNLNIKDVESMEFSIEHRGPDGGGHYLDGPLALIHRRLSIIDLSVNANQPMYSSCGNYIMIFNGEIYNYQELKAILVAKGFEFKTNSDSEVLLNGYIEFKEGLLNMLNGIFAFAIYSIKEKELIIARDQMGVKPIYFYNYNGTFLFGSEIKSFINYPDFNKELNYSAIKDYIKYLYSPSEKTPFRYVNKLNPGHLLKIKINDLNNDLRYNVDYKKYFDIPLTTEYTKYTRKQAIEQTGLVLYEAVKRQLVSDVPVGFFLSGGLDSSLIVGLAKIIQFDTNLNVFTLATDEKQFKSEGFSSDLFYAKLLAKRFDLNLNIIKDEFNMERDFDPLIWQLDEPQSDPAALHIYNISKQARDLGIKVLLSGTGGDDVFTGYRRHEALGYQKYFNLFPTRFIDFIVKHLGTKIQNPQIRRFRKFLLNQNVDVKYRIASYFEWLNESNSSQLFNPEIITEGCLSVDSENQFHNLIDKLENNVSIIDKMLYLENKTFLVNHNLNYTDKLGMKAGVEVRVPFLDLEVIKFAFSLDPKFKLHKGTTKYVLREYAKLFLPNELIYRSKAGFGSPVREWIQNSNKDFVNDRLSKTEIERIGIFDFNEVSKLIKSNQKNEIDASYSIWGLMAVQSWYNQFAK